MIIQTKSFELAIYASGSPESHKLALVMPGRLDTKDYVHMRSLVDYLGEQDYYAVSFDSPGIWESPGDISLYSTTNQLKAIDELIEYYGNKPTVLAGHSRGGSIAMLAGIKNPHVTHFVAIMSHHGPTTIGTIQPGEAPKLSYRDLPPGNMRTTEQKEFLMTADYFQDQLQYDALKDLETCTKPKLFICGSQDALVTPEHVKETYQAAAEPKSFIELNTEHDYRLHPEFIDKVNQCIGEFLSTN